MATAAAPPVPGRGWEQVRGPAAHLSAGVWGGIICGFVIGGVGGRLAMFLLRLTSDPSLSGLETDDGFLIGSFTGSTIFLLLVCAAFGLLGGLFYLSVRGWIPRPYRALAMAVFLGSAGGATIIKPDGIDFTLVEPHSLSVFLFIALPASYGAALSFVVENLLDRKDRRTKPWSALAIVPLLGLALVGPIGLIVLAVAFSGWMLNLRFPLTALWHSRWVTASGRFVLMTVTCATLATLIADIATVL